MPENLVPFTEYVLPNGRRQEIKFAVPEPVANMAAKLREEGAKFEIEKLRTGQISMTVEIDEDEEGVMETRVLASDITPNLPTVVKIAVSRLIETAYRDYFGSER